MHRRLILGGLAALPLTSLSVGWAAAQEMQFFRIGSGSTGGTYFPIAGLIATAISNPPGSRPCDEGGSCGVPGLIAIAQSSHASVANVTAVQEGRIESGLAAADIVYTAFNGLGAFAEEGAFDNLRVIANLFPEHLQLVLPKGRELNSIADLKGQRVGIAQSGSGSQVVALKLLELNGVGPGDIEAFEQNSADSAQMLQDGLLDAFFYVAGTPTAAMARLAKANAMDLYRMREDEIASFLEAVPFYYADSISADTYVGIDEPVPTVAVGAQWVTGADQPASLIYAVTKALWNDNSRTLFDNGHSKGATIQLDTALSGVLTPIHPGAMMFYREIGRQN